MKPDQTLRSHHHSRLIAGIASTIGAAALGIGIVPLLPAIPMAAGLAFLILGLAVHSAGMILAHKADAVAGFETPRWVQVLTWLCWMALIGLAALAAFAFTNWDTI